MKPTKMKSSGELEEYIAELKEQLKQAKLDKREALAREQKQAREWRTDLAHTLGETVLTVTGCDWTRLDLEALREWLLDHAGEMQTLLVGPDRTPEEAHDALIAFRRGQAAEAKQETQQAEVDAPQEDAPAAGPTEPENNTEASATDAGGTAIPTTDSVTADGNDNETQDTPWTAGGVMAAPAGVELSLNTRGTKPTGAKASVGFDPF